jgi:hypothetical protein
VIGNDLLVSTFGSVPAGDKSLLVQIISNAVRCGYAIALLDGTERIDMRSAKEQKAGIELQYLTLDWAGGEPAKVRTKVGALMRRIQKDVPEPNIGIELSHSGLVALSTSVGLTITRPGAAPGWGWSIGHGFGPEHVVLVPPSVLSAGPVQIVGSVR